MKAIKTIGAILLGLILLVVVISFFLPSKAAVVRSTVVNAPIENAFTQVNVLENWINWSPWYAMDSNMAITYQGPAEGAGASYSWTSDHEKVGAGKLTITNSEANALINTEVQFGEMGSAMGTWTFAGQDDGTTTVTWQTVSDMSGFPVIGKYFGLMMDGMLGPSLEDGLARLKQVAEQLPTKPALEIMQVGMDIGQWALTIRETTNHENHTAIHNSLMEEIQAFMAEQELEADAAPLAFYYAYGKEKIDFAVGIPVKDSVETSGRIALTKIPPGNYVTATHIGHYDLLVDTYGQISDWMEEKGLEATGAPRQVYITNPEEEADPNKWYTQVFFPI